jgi:hypothetical protein
MTDNETLLRNLLREVDRKLGQLTDDVRDLQLRARALESHMEALRTALASGFSLKSTRLDLIERRLHASNRARRLNLQDAQD